MLFESSEQAKFLVPMTLALTFGLLFGMIATLFLIPACYAILDDVNQTSNKALAYFRTLFLKISTWKA